MFFFCLFVLKRSHLSSVVSICVTSSLVISLFHNFNVFVSSSMSVTGSCGCLLLAVATVKVGPHSYVFSEAQTYWLKHVGLFYDCTFNDLSHYNKAFLIFSFSSGRIAFSPVFHKHLAPF